MFRLASSNIFFRFVYFPHQPAAWWEVVFPVSASLDSHTRHCVSSEKTQAVSWCVKCAHEQSSVVVRPCGSAGFRPEHYRRPAKHPHTRAPEFLVKSSVIRVFRSVKFYVLGRRLATVVKHDVKSSVKQKPKKKGEKSPECKPIVSLSVRDKK